MRHPDCYFHEFHRPGTKVELYLENEPKPLIGVIVRLIPHIAKVINGKTHSISIVIFVMEDNLFDYSQTDQTKADKDKYGQRIAADRVEKIEFLFNKIVF
ncbi:MAG: hypothetical protein WCL14_14290 [Bacteroidota bacterium]